MESYPESPISNLPHDVLLEILFLVRDMYSGQEKNKFCHNATSVSASWKHALHTTPSWWNELEIYYPCRLDIIQKHLALGKTAPLRLEISLSEDIEKQDINTLTDTIIPHLHRCWRFSFQGETSEESAIYLTKCIISKRDMPLLRHFTFSILGGADDETNLSVVLPEWSSLSTLRLGGLVIGYLGDSLPQITQLHLSRGEDRERISFIRLGRILKSCPNLTHLALYDDILAYYSEVIDKHVTHSNIVSILILGNMLHASEFLVYVDAPNLRELVIAPVVAGDFRRLADMDPSACQRKFQALRKLTLAPAYKQAIMRCQKASVYFPNVETLIFANLYPMQFRRMFLHSPDAYPNLLHLGVTSVWGGFIEIVLDVVEMRKTRGVTAKLRTVCFDTESFEKVRSAVEENKQRFVDLGLEVVCANLWDDQRQDAMFSDNKTLFVGRYEMDTDSDFNPDDG